MVKGTPNLRLFFHSRKDSPTKSNADAYDVSAAARPPLSTLSASARNNLGAGVAPPAHAAPNSQHAKIDTRQSPHGKRSSAGLAGQASLYPHAENVDSNAIAGSATPEKLGTPFGTPKSKAKRSSGCLPLPPSSGELEEGLHQLSSAGTYGECLARTPSNMSSIATSSDEEATATEDSFAPSSTSESEAENVHSKPQSATTRREAGLRRLSLGPKIEAAVSKLERTPTRALRPSSSSSSSRSSSASASPGSLRAGAQRALVLQPPTNGKEASEAPPPPPHFELQEDLSFWNDHNVQVLIRTRPISGPEAAKQDFSRCLRQDGAHAVTWLGQPETRFTFDHVAGEKISQEKLFRVAGLPMVENCMAGYNSCMFAYGQTGSGKTHTMLGDIDDLADRPNDNRGMTPRIFEYLFSRIRKEEQDRQLEQLRYVCKCSFLEIYNEQITDLLEPSSSNLQMREDSKKGVYVENLTEVEVSSVRDVVVLLLKGAANRKVAATNMNRESSRSHSVFTCTIESKWETNSLTSMRFGRLNLVDLAGSERQKTSGAEGDRLKEAANINKSLSTLGLVIMILVDVANGKQRHVPYRDSKLTFLLQDSLGGNSKTAIIATVSPSSCCAMETLSTLKFAQRAKFIQNNAVINEDASGEVLALRHEIQQLKEEVSRLRCQTLSSMRRDCRRESNEFFRMSLTGKDLFDAAEKDRLDEGEDLKSAELLEKIKALETVLAGALRREQAADAATRRLSTENEKLSTLVQEREEETQSCKKLLGLEAERVSQLQAFAASELSADSYMADENKVLAEKLAIAEQLRDRNPEIAQTALDNARLTEQLRSYQAFYDSGERETMAGEIQGLRDQVLELLDGKIAVERGSLSLTIAQGDSYRKELETCRNDLTNCLEASSQMQRQVGELQALVDQLTEQCAEKEKELEALKLRGSGRDAGRLREAEIQQALHEEEIAELKMRLQERQKTAACDAEVRARLELELQDALQQTHKIESELQEAVETWSSKYAAMVSQKEQEVKALQFGWEAATAKLLHDLAEGDRALIEAEREMEEIIGEDWLLKSLQEKAPRWSLESEKSLREVDKEHDYFKGRESFNSDDIFAKRKRTSSLAQGAAAIVEEKLRLEGEVARLELELAECKRRAREFDDSETGFEILQREKLELEARIEILAAKSEENMNLKGEMERLQSELQERAEAVQSMLAEMEALHTEMADLEKAKAGAQEQAEALAVKSQEASILALELQEARERGEEAQAAVVDMARDNVELREESAQLKVEAQEAAVLQAEMEREIAELEVALGEYRKERSGLRREIKQLRAALEETQGRNDALATAVAAAKQGVLALEAAKQELHLEVELRARTTESTELVREELRKTVASLHAELGKKDERMKELELEAESQTKELEATKAELAAGESRLNDLETTLADRIAALEVAKTELAHSAAVSAASASEREEARRRADDSQAVALATAKQVHELQDELDTKSTELGVLVDQLHTVTSEMRAQIAHFQQTSVAATQELENERVAAQKLQHDLDSATASLKQLRIDLRAAQDKEQHLVAAIHDSRASLASSDADLRVARDSIVLAQEKIDVDAETISLLQENVEELESELSRKEELLQGLEFDISLLQEHTAEDTDYKQELLEANAKILELQGDVAERAAELKELGSMKAGVDEELNQKAAAMRLVEADLENSRASADLAATEIQSLRTQIAHLQRTASSLEAEVAERAEAASSLEKELMVTRVTSTRMTLECRHKTEALASVQDDLARVSRARDELRAQAADLARKGESLQAALAAKLAQIDVMHGDILVAMMTEHCFQELMSDLEARFADVESQRGAMAAELARKDEGLGELNSELLVAREMTTTMEARMMDLQAETADLKLEVAQAAELMSSLQGEGAAESARLMEERGELQRRVEDLWGRQCAAEVEVALKDAAMRSLQGELTAAAARSSEQIQELQARIANLQEERQNLEMELARAKAAASSVAADLAAATAAASAMEHRSADLVAEKATLEGELSQKGEAIACMESKHAEVQAENEALEGALRERAAEIKRLEEEGESLRCQIAEHHTEKRTLQEEIAQKITAMGALQAELETAHNAATLAAQENLTTNAQIATLQGERDALQATVAQITATLSSLEGELLVAAAAASASRDQVAAMEAKMEAEAAATSAAILSLEQEAAQTQTAIKSLEDELAAATHVADSATKERSSLEAQVAELLHALAIKTGDLRRLEEELTMASEELSTLRARAAQQELLLAKSGDALAAAAADGDALRAQVESLDAELKEQENAFKGLERRVSAAAAGDEVTLELSALRDELAAAQALVAAHKAAALEAQKFAEVNILRANGKEEETRALKASVSTLRARVGALENQLEVAKRDAERRRQACDELEMELQGMKNRMTMLQAVHSTGSRNFKGFQAAQAASLDLQRRLEEKETEAVEMYKKLTALHSERDAQTSRIEEAETELAHAHQELDELQTQCEDKDTQINSLNRELEEAEALTQDLMRDLHGVKLDISNYASLVSQQQLELISERARHSDESQEKDEELSNLQTQLNQERQNWMLEMNHKQAEIVVARVLSEKMRLKNKTLAAEYKKLKADHAGKKKKLKVLEQQLQHLTESRRSSVGTESDDFDEVQQFHALLAQANDELAQHQL